jgi:hypothetical protein
MAISQALIDRGTAVGLAPHEGESSRAFSSRVRKAEAESTQQSAQRLVGRRGVFLK